MITNSNGLYYKLGTWCLYKRKDELLLINRTKQPHQGLWIPVGGEVGLGESPCECACREFQVESGYIISNLTMKGILTEYSVYGFNWVNFIFVVNKADGSLRQGSKEGIVDWIPLKDYHKMPTPEVDKRIIPKIFYMKSFYLGKVIYDQNLHIESYKEE